MTDLKKPLSIYVHVPFCEKRCPYCDFHSYENGGQEFYFFQTAKDIIEKSAELKDYCIQSIYFGGGTPSFLDEKYLCGILSTIYEVCFVDPYAEITIECNPNSFTEEKAVLYSHYGINRVSIGVQSFCDETLKILGRQHSAQQAKDAIKLACEFFDNVSIDLMYGIPSGKIILPEEYLSIIQHVSAYCLESDKFEKVSDEQCLKEQKQIQKCLANHFIERYEVSNYAMLGFDCIHNMNYWECGEWIGFGEGAKSHFEEEWDIEDKVMMGLRLMQGIHISLVQDKIDVVNELVLGGFLEINNYRVSCTDKGFDVLSAVTVKLI